MLLGLGKPKEVSKLSEDVAAELGAEMLGELLIFGFGVACLVFEYRRQIKKEYNKEEYIHFSINELTNRINELITFNQINEAKIRELTRIVAKIEEQKDA